MVEGSALRRNVAASLLIVGDELEALPERARGEDSEGSWWGGEWMANMGRFEWLAELAKQGTLDTSEMARYRKLLQLLYRHYALTLHLDLPIPELVLREAEHLVGKPLDRAA